MTSIKSINGHTINVLKILAIIIINYNWFNDIFAVKNNMLPNMKSIVNSNIVIAQYDGCMPEKLLDVQ